MMAGRPKRRARLAKLAKLHGAPLRAEVLAGLERKTGSKVRRTRKPKVSAVEGTKRYREQLATDRLFAIDQLEAAASEAGGELSRDDLSFFLQYVPAKVMSEWRRKGLR